MPARSCAAALGQAERRGYVARNVVALTDAPAVKVDERPVLTPEQAKQLFDALHDDRLLPLYLVTIHTGLRQGELLALRWSDVDLEAGTLTVTGTLDRKMRQRTDPKTDKSRRNVPLTPQAMEALQVHQVRQNLEGTQGTDDLVFTSARGTALYDSNIRKHWHRVSFQPGTALDAVAQPAPLCGHDHACPRCPHRGRVPRVRSCVHPHHRRHLWPCVTRDQQTGRERHGEGLAMKDCRRDRYQPCTQRKPWPIPMKPPTTPRTPSRLRTSASVGSENVAKLIGPSHTGYV